MFDLTSRILIVDDMESMRRVTRATLKSLGFINCVEASDGVQAWSELLHAAPPIEVVLSDWNMPHGNGLKLLKQIRSDARFCQLPFVFISGKNKPDDIVRGLAEGANGFAVKPITKATLALELKAIFQNLKVSR